MNIHPPRWGTFTVALLLALVLLGWARWEHDLLDSDQAGLAVAITLIVLGIVGIAATAWRSWPGRGPETTGPVTDADRPGDALDEPAPQDVADVEPGDDHEPTRTFPTTPEGDRDEQEAHPQQ